MKIARHFLADRLVRQGQPERALEVLAPSLMVLPDDWLLSLTQAAPQTPGRRPNVRLGMPHRRTSARATGSDRR